MSEKIKTAVMEVIKAHMEGEDKNTKAVLSDILESVNELEALEQKPCDECRNKHTSFCGNCKEYDEFEPCDNAISREAVLDTLDRMDKALDENRTVEDYKALLIECYKVLTPVTQKSETVTEFADRCRECGARYGKLLEQKSGKWIKTTDRLPEDKTYVLTTIKIPNRVAHARSGWYQGGFFHNDNGDTWNSTDREVIAWMPLPEPYEPQESEDKE